MNKLITAVFILVLAGCASTGVDVQVVEVKIPVPIFIQIEPLEPYETKCDKIPVSANTDYERIGRECKEDLILLKRRDEVWNEKVKQHNGNK